MLLIRKNLTHHCPLTLCLLLMAALAVTFTTQPTAQAADKQSFSEQEVKFYNDHVKPILESNCVKCHGGKKTKAGFDLTHRAGLLKGGDFGPSYNPKNPDKSFILEMISYKDIDFEMPPDDKLPQKEIDILTKWVKMGAPYPADALESTKNTEREKFTEEQRQYWAYQEITKPDTPKTNNKDFVKSPIDTFILSKLEANGLKPNPKADKVSLVRRAYYNLIGLPPTPAQVKEFVEDNSPDAWEKLIDRLLASPQYGEKWGRHWLDLVRYAETNGYERDNPKPHVWKYRDYVIRSFNEDKPYDQFLTEQLAGDEIENPTADSIIATGYYRLGIWNDEPADRLLEEYDVLDGIVSTTAQVTLGMTVGCARCHDHKKDPILQKDYYSMLAFFRDVSPMHTSNMVREIKTEDSQAKYEQKRKAKQAREDQLYKKIYDIEQQAITAASKNETIDVAHLTQSDLLGLTYKFYRDTFVALPNDFTLLRHENEGKIATNFFTLDVATRHEAIGIVYEGKLNVPADGEYTFHIHAKDGLRLNVDDKNIYNQPGVQTHKGDVTVKLTKGLHPIELDYFNVEGKGLLNIGWSGPGFSRKPLSDTFAPETVAGNDGVILSDSKTEPRNWKHTTAVLTKGWMKPEFDDSSWKTAPAGFGREGTPGAIVRTPWHTADIWLRKSFNLKEIPTSLKLSIHHDEDAEVYLNGKLIYQDKGYLRNYKVVPLKSNALKALKTGENVIAIHCKQTGGGQYIDAGLYTNTTGTLTIKELVKTHGDELIKPGTTQTYNNLIKELEKVKKQPIPGEYALAVFERGKQKTHILRRGNPHVPGREVKPDFLEILDPEASPEIQPTNGSSGKRLALAKWITSKDNKLTARVMANRIWQYHFDRGIVESSSDFGTLGVPPTHPELLDYLATQLMEGDWKLKQLHKKIMMSNTYQMSSKAHSSSLAKDPANRLFWRFNMRRLSAEEIRDTILAVAGNLNLQMGGPSVYPPMPQAMIKTASNPARAWGKSPPDQQVRRTIYVHLKRSLKMPLLTALDLADTDSSCAVRFATTVPTQSLTLLNGQFTNSQAKVLAERLKKEAGDNSEAQIKRAFLLLTGRPATNKELKEGLEMLADLQNKHNLSKDEALRIFCLMTLNLNELVYLD